MSGKFIAIEGTEGSGKTPQFERLILALPEHVRVATLDFPQYQEPSSYLLQKYLTGKYGGDVQPHAASILFAADRFDAKLKIREWLDEGRLVIANRYVASNMAYHGTKFPERGTREHFYQWLYQLEYTIFGIPKPDISIVLHGLPRAAKGTAGAPAPDAYAEIAAIFPGDFQVIECAPGGMQLSPDAIHREVLAVVRSVTGI